MQREIAQISPLSLAGRSWTLHRALLPSILGQFSGTLHLMSDEIAQVRPGVFGWPTFWFMYVAAAVLGGMVGTLVTALPLVAVRESSAQPVFAVVGTVVWIAAVVLAIWWAHPKITRFIDRAHFRLTDDHLHLGRGDKVTINLSEVTDVWFGDRTFGASATRPATRQHFRVAVLGLANGRFVPVSPPPGTFVGGQSAEPVVAPVGAFVVGVDDFMKALLARLEPVLRDGDEMPWRMRALSGPAHVNWVYGPGAPPLPKGSMLPNWTYI
ncbi:hypothetical protein AB1046_08875 [Promicromonospora sp. Populi]|uniref:hypothetical protein n=1 Tax=Promicromonospora sp. Populi TaxID=3239420 RepID=UPI0034E1D4DB